MRSVFALVLLAVAAPALASTERMSQVSKRAAASGPTDVEILNYALTLEHLEKNFYFQGLQKYRPNDFINAGYGQKVFDRFQSLAIQEKTHVLFLAGALGDAGVSECKYDFTAAFSSIQAFVATARVLEGVGTAAYLGAAPDITSKAYLAAAGSILTIEARHTSYLNEVQGASGFPVPFETSLDYAQVYSLAAPFIKPGTCGAAKALPSSLKEFPKLAFSTSVPRSGHTSAIKFSYINGKQTGYYAAILNGGKTLYAKVNHGSDGIDRINIPSGLNGVTYFVITTSSTAISDSNTVAGPALTYL